MVVVRSYGLPEQEARGVQNPYPQVPAAGDLASFGGNQARDLQQAGANLERTADTTFGIFERVAKEANDLKVDSDMNKFVVEKQKTLVDFAQLKGEDAIKGAGAATESLLNSKKTMMEGAANDYQRNVLSRRLDAHMLDASGSITQHVAREAQAARVQTKLSTLNNLNNQGVIDQNDPKAVDTQLGIVRDIATDLAKTVHGQSADPAIVKDLVGKAESTYITGILKSKIASGDMSAPGFYDKYKDKISADARPALEQAIDTLKTSTDAQNYARSGGGAGGDAKASSDYTTRVTGGYEGGTEKDGMVPNRLGSGAFGPGQIMEGTWADIRKAHPELNLPADRTAASRAQHISAFNAFTIDNASALQAANLPATPANLYLAHRFGAKGAEQVLKANPATPLASILPADWFTKNPDMNGQTAGSFIQLAQARMAGVTQIPGVTNVAVPSNIADPLAGQVNAATAGRLAPTLESAVDAATAPPAQQAVDAAQGVPNVRQQLIAIENDRRGMLAEIEADYAAQKIDYKTRKARTAAVNTLHEQSKQGTELYKNQLWEAIWAQIRSNPLKMPDANLISQIDPREVESLQKMVDRNIQGKKTTTDWGVYTELRQRLLNPDPEVSGPASKLHPMQFRPRMADDEFKEITKLQEHVRTGDPNKNLTRVRTNDALVNSTLLTMGIDTTPRPGSSDATKAATFHRVFQNELTLFEAQKGGKTATPQEVQQILDGMVKKVTTEGWLFNSETPTVFVTKVPDAERSQIISAIRAGGGIPTEERILEVYRHSLITQPTQTEIPRPLEPPMLGTPGGTATPPASGRPAFPPSVLRVPAAPRVIENPPESEAEPQSPRTRRYGGQTFGGQTFGGQTFGRSSGRE